MKYIKKFEMNEDKPSNGDYVICGGKYFSDSSFNKECLNLVINKIGIINNMTYSYSNLSCMIKYNLKKSDNINWSGNYFCELDDILYWSKDKEELELILKSNKFNI